MSRRDYHAAPHPTNMTENYQDTSGSPLLSQQNITVGVDAGLSAVSHTHRQDATLPAHLQHWPAIAVITDIRLHTMGASATGSLIRNQNQPHDAPQPRQYRQFDYQPGTPVVTAEEEYGMPATGFGPHQNQVGLYIQPNAYDDRVRVRAPMSVPANLQNTPNFAPNRNIQMDPMTVLSAESYIDGVTRRGGTRRSAPHGGQYLDAGRDVGTGPIFGLSAQVESGKKGRRAPEQSEDSEPAEQRRRKKKQKLSEEDEEDEASKKSRGRPRLDTKDETAADRRRTQIRMAQRAYRNRKETTIQSLEKQVQDLRGTNEEMSNIFMNLYDFAVGKGLIHREPEFAQHLRSTTERFLALAGSISADDSMKEEVAVHNQQRDASANSIQSHSRQESSSEIQDVMTSVWGYQVSKEDTPDDPSSPNEYVQQPLQAVPLPEDHQIISRATIDNASFINLDFLDSMQQYRVEIPETSFDYSYFLSPEGTLPLPASYSVSENTFARRLQRSTTESGWRLINSRNTSRIEAVFGFCLRFETKDQIKQRLWKVLSADSKSALYNWKEPFLHLGGSGTFYPRDQNISGDLQPKILSGMSMGPFSASVMDTRQNDMLTEYKINVPGYEGEFFDSNDVEGYLRGRGIDIGVNAEFVDLDLDQLEFHEQASNSHSSGSLDDISPKTPVPIVSDVMGVSETGRDSEFFTASEHTDCSAPYSMNFPDWSSGSNEPTKSSGNPFDLTGPIFNSVTGPEQSAEESINGKRKRGNERIVTLSVSHLVNELIGKGVCLGRAPGYRPSEVDLAVRRAIIASF